MKPSQRHAVHANRLVEFRNAYVALINASHREYQFPATVYVAAGDTMRWTQLRDAVARAAGPAAPVYPRYGTLFQLRSGGWVQDRANPVLHWETAMRNCELLAPDTLVGALDGAIARAYAERDDAQAREKGFTGLVARFLRWPWELREAVGGGAVARRSAYAVGVGGQVIAGLITAGILAGIAKLASRLLT